MSAPRDPFAREVLLAHRDWVRAMARTMVVDASAADDLAQDAWVAALRSPPTRRGEERAWFARVLRNLSRNRHREGTRRDTRERMAARREHAASPDELVAEAEAHRRAVGAVLELEDAARTTVLLRFFEDLSVPEIAERTGVPLETAKARLRRALAQLRARLDEDYEGNRRAWVLLLAPETRGSAPTTARGPATAAATVVGGLMATKTVVAAVIVALALGTWGVVWFAGRGTGRSSPPADQRHSSATGGVDRAGSDAAGTSTPRGRQRERSAETAGTTAEESAQKSVDAGADRGWRLAGRVVRADGSPVPESRLQLGGMDGPRAAQGWTSGPAGQFVVILTEEEAERFLGGSDGAFLWASAPGQVDRALRVEGPTDDLLFRLKTAVPVRVRVRDVDGSPMAAAPVVLHVQDELGNRARRPRPTDAAGEVVFANVVAADASVSAVTYAREPVEYVRAQARTTAEGATIELRFRGLRSVEVNVTFRGDDVPVAHCEVENAARERTQVTWEEGGATSTVNVPPDAVRLRVATPVGVSAWHDLAAGAVSVDVPFDTTSVSWLRIDPSGEDVTYLYVAAAHRDAGEIRMTFSPIAHFARDGLFRIPVRAGHQYAVYRPNGRAWLLSSLSPETTRLSGADHRVDLVVSVRGASGAAMASAKVTAAAAIGGTGFSGERPVGRAQADGTFAVAVVPGIEYRVVVEAPGHGTEVRPVTPVRPFERIDVTLPVAASDVRLQILGGEEGTTFRVMQIPDGAEIRATLGKDGEVSFAPPASGWAAVIVGRSRFLLVDTRAAAASGGPVAVPHAAATVDVEITTEDGPLPPSAPLALLGIAPIAPGVFAVGVPGAVPAPVGRYVPVSFGDGEIVVFAPREFSDTVKSAVLPGAAARETWRTGDVPDPETHSLVAVVAGPGGAETHIPIGFLRLPGLTRWRSETLEIRSVPHIR